MPDPIAAPPPASPVAAAPTAANAPEPISDVEEYVVDGKTVSLNKAQRSVAMQKALAADKRMKEAADKRAQAEDLLKLFEADPEAALVKLGKDPSKLFGSHLEKKAKLELMSPEQREADRLAKERDEYKSKLEAHEKEKLTARRAELDQRNHEALQRQLVGLADKLGLDQHPDVLGTLCDIALEFMDYDIVPTTEQIGEEFVRREKEHIEQRDKKLLSVLKGDKLLAYLGPKALEEVKAALAGQATASLKDIPKPKAKGSSQQAAKTTLPKGASYLRESDFDKKFLK